MKTFYVMHWIDGDECLLAHCPTLEAAVTRLLTEHARDPRAALSVWTSDGHFIVPSVEAAKRLACRGLMKPLQPRDADQ